MLLTIHEVIQESFGFSPNELVFNHTVLGPVAFLDDEWSSQQPPDNVLGYDSDFKYHLYQVCAATRKMLRCKMQHLFTWKSEFWGFEVGD